MSIIIGSARNGENGAHGNKAGDQSGGEVSTQTFYMHSSGWVILRAKSDSVASKLATAMQDACDNNHIGYDQDDRDTLLTQYKKYGSIKAVATNCECDCSSLVRVCVYQASGKLLSDFNTTSEPDTLVASGLFEKKSCSGSSSVLNGDILCTPVKGHTAIVISGAPRSGSSSGGTTSSTGSGTTGSTTGSGTDASFDESLAGTYKVTASSGLNIRSGAGTKYSKLVAIPKGTSVKNFGYYAMSGSTKWLYVQVTYGGKTYEGYASSNYLSKSSSSSGSSSGSGTTSSSKKPSYTVGNTYTTQVDRLNVRKGAGTNYSTVGYSGLTSNGKLHAYSNGSLKKGTKVTCKAVKTVGSDIWIQIPSGWIAAYYSGKTYVS